VYHTHQRDMGLRAHRALCTGYCFLTGENFYRHWILTQPRRCVVYYTHHHDMGLRTHRTLIWNIFLDFWEFLPLLDLETAPSLDLERAPVCVVHHMHQCDMGLRAHRTLLWSSWECRSRLRASSFLAGQGGHGASPLLVEIFKSQPYVDFV